MTLAGNNGTAVADQAPRSELPPRTEDEIVSGILRVPVGQQTRTLRVLSIAEARSWKSGLVEVIGGGIGTMNLETTGDLGSVAEAATDRILDLVVRYDVDATLGGREWLETNATDAQVYAVFRRLLEVSFPFVRDLRSALAEVRALGLADLLSSAGSPPASSTNGASPDGASASTGALLTSS